MKNGKRNLNLCLFIAAPLACLAVIGWKYQTDAAQQTRNRALIAAVKADRPGDVIAALRQGANPDACDIPPDNRTLWQKVTTFFRPVKTNEGAPLSALRLAVIHQWEGRPPSVSFTILKALHEAGATDEGDIPPFRAQFAEQARIVKERRDRPPVTPEDLNVNAPANTLAGYLCRYGMSAQGYANVARCEALQGYYAAAVSNFHIAECWLPQDAEIARERAQAQEWAGISQRIKAQISPSRRLLALTPFPDEAGHILWVTLYCHEAKDEAKEDARVAVYQTQNGACERVFTSGILKAAGSEDGSGFSEANLYVLNMTGRRSPEIVVQASSHTGASSSDANNSGASNADANSTAHLTIYEWNGARLKTLFSRQSSDPFQIVDLRGDGQAEVWETLKTDAAPPLLDAEIYAYRGGKFVPATAEFPSVVQGRIAEALKNFYGDKKNVSTLHSLAYYYSLSGDWRQAETYYRKAERFCREKIANSGDEDDPDDWRYELKQIRSRDADKR